MGIGIFTESGVSMNYKSVPWRAISAAAAFSLLAAGCNDSKPTSSSQADAPQSATAPSAALPFEEHSFSTQNSETVYTTLSSLNLSGTPYTSEIGALFTERDLSGSYDAITADIALDGTAVTIDGSGATAENGVLTITDEGTYLISGTLTDGQIVVDSEGKVQLLLDGADITCTDSAGIYIRSAKKAFITTVEGTVNSVTDGSSYVYAAEGENEPDAAIFSTDDLTLNGSGTLIVNGNYNEGITCKDNIVITDGTIEVTAPGNGIKGKDYTAVSGGVISVTAGADGIKASNATDAGMGFVYIEGGVLTIDAQEDGIQAETELLLCGGTLDIRAGGGTANAQPHAEQGFGWDQNQTTAESSDSVSTKGLKAGTLLWIAGSTIGVDAADDGLHSNGDLLIEATDLSIAAGGDGIHADAQAEISGGSVSITQSYEGLEAARILVTGGTVDITASDDGFNGSDGTSQGGMGTLSDCTLEILGGTVHVDAGGDGIDSNGTMLIGGGTVLVDGPTNNGNGAIDGNGGITCSGGVLIAAGSSGMAQAPSGTQNCLVVTLDSMQEGGTLVTLCDGDGAEILSFAPEKSYNSVVISTPALLTDSTCSVYIGGTSDAVQSFGLYEAGGYRSDGTLAGSVTITEPLSYIGTAGGMGGFGHPGGMQPPDGGMGAPGGMQPPLPR